MAFLSSLLFLGKEIGTTKSKHKLKGLFKQKKEIKILSAARVFLFGARDIWFVVAIPVYFSTAFNWNHTKVGSFMAMWVIGYGFIQAAAPILLKKWTKGLAPDGKMALHISVILAIIMGLITILFPTGFYSEIMIIAGLMIFGVVFALNSSVHSFLVLV